MHVTVVKEYSISVVEVKVKISNLDSLHRPKGITECSQTDNSIPAGYETSNPPSADLSGPIILV